MYHMTSHEGKCPVSKYFCILLLDKLYFVTVLTRCTLVHKPITLLVINHFPPIQYLVSMCSNELCWN